MTQYIMAFAWNLRPKESQLRPLIERPEIWHNFVDANWWHSSHPFILKNVYFVELIKALMHCTKARRFLVINKNGNKKHPSLVELSHCAIINIFADADDDVERHGAHHGLYWMMEPVRWITDGQLTVEYRCKRFLFARRQWMDTSIRAGQVRKKTDLQFAEYCFRVLLRWYVFFCCCCFLNEGGEECRPQLISEKSGWTIIYLMVWDKQFA